MILKGFLAGAALIVWMGIGCPAKIQAQTGPVPESGRPAGGGPLTVILQDGSGFEVDDLREESGRYIYRMGNMQGFLDRSEVAAIRAVAAANRRRERPLPRFNLRPDTGGSTA